MNHDMFVDYLKTPIGLIEITASDKGIKSIYFVDKNIKQCKSNAHTKSCQSQLSEYFSKKRQSFDLSLDQSGTQFQQDVWNELEQIEYGKKASYSEIANNINNPKAVRAVGAANGKNPLSIVVPCHRVIGSNNKLTGYAGGIERKKWLLEHEGIAFKN